MNRDKTHTLGEVAEAWENWCGKTKWSEGLRRLAWHGFKITWYCGYPKSHSAIPLCFTLVAPDGTIFNGSRLRDIQSAITHAQS